VHNRRRFLQILAAAPFAPWKEILEEVAKPIITYSIPSNLDHIDHLDLSKWGATNLVEAAVEGVELESWSKAIPDLIFTRTSLYDRIKSHPEILSKPSVFRAPMRVVRVSPVYVTADGTIE
jgi:hypothetical protein